MTEGQGRLTGTDETVPALLSADRLVRPCSFFCSALSSLLFLNVDACTVIVKPKARPEFILSADINGDKQVFLVHDGKKISTEEAARLILEPMLFP